MLKPETIEIQYKLARYCRDGIVPELPGVLPDRLPNYRRLVYNVMYGLMEQSYPIAYSRLSVAEFKSILDSFFVEHDSQSPQVWKVPGEFYSFVDSSDLQVKKTYPYLRDLMLMEWNEILVYNRSNRELKHHNAAKPEDEDRLVLNPNSEVLELSYPVYKGAWDRILENKGDYRLLLYRNNESFKVHFLEITPLHEKLFEFLLEGEKLMPAIVKSLNLYRLEKSESNIQSLKRFIQKLFEDGFVLGKMG